MPRQDYRNPDHLKFVDDMDEAGFEVTHYRGRYSWEGPAVIVDALQNALGVTSVRCQWDHMGLSWVVYPQAYDRDLYAAAASIP